MENLKNFSLEHKLDILERIEDSEIFTKENISILEKLYNDNNTEVRNKVAQILVFAPTLFSDGILISMLGDADVLVRANACDSLCNSKSDEAIEKLKTLAIKDKALVRGYAILSLADIVINKAINPSEMIEFFIRSLSNETSKWVKIIYYRSLCVLGDNKFYDSILSELNNRYYINRCLTMKIINELTNESNLKETINALENRLKVEKALSVKYLIENAIKTLSS